MNTVAYAKDFAPMLVLGIAIFVYLVRRGHESVSTIGGVAIFVAIMAIGAACAVWAANGASLQLPFRDALAPALWIMVAALALALLAYGLVCFTRQMKKEEEADRITASRERSVSL